jgi:hypothetical protein
VLDGRGVEFAASSWYISSRAARSSLKHAHLDQTMGVQGGIDFFFDGGGQAIAADEDHGVQVVGIGAMFPALCRSQLNLGHGRIMSAAGGRTCRFQLKCAPDAMGAGQLPIVERQWSRQ